MPIHMLWYFAAGAQQNVGRETNSGTRKSLNRRDAEDAKRARKENREKCDMEFEKQTADLAAEKRIESRGAPAHTGALAR